MKVGIKILNDSFNSYLQSGSKMELISYDECIGEEVDIVLRDSDVTVTVEPFEFLNAVLLTQKSSLETYVEVFGDGDDIAVNSCGDNTSLKIKNREITVKTRELISAIEYTM